MVPIFVNVYSYPPSYSYMDTKYGENNKRLKRQSSVVVIAKIKHVYEMKQIIESIVIADKDSRSIGSNL